MAYDNQFYSDVIENQITPHLKFSDDNRKIWRINNDYFLNNEENSKTWYRIVPFHSVIFFVSCLFQVNARP